MEFRDYIEEGIAKCGTAVALAKLLDQDATAIRNAKAHRRGLPLVACYKLAELIGERPEAVAAASAMVTEKDAGAREYLRPFVQAGKLAHPMIAVVVTVGIAVIQAANELASLTP